MEVELNPQTLGGPQNWQPEQAFRSQREFGMWQAAVTGDDLARESFIKSNYGLTVIAAKRLYSQCRYHGFDINFVDSPDITQIGQIALNNAIDHFDSHLGYRFSSYAVRIITRDIYRNVNQSWPGVVLPANINVFEVASMEKHLGIELGRPASDLELAEALGVSLRIVEGLRLAHRLGRHLGNLDDLIDWENLDLVDDFDQPSVLEVDEERGCDTAKGYFPDCYFDPPEETAVNSLLIEKLLGRLLDRELMIIKLRYGLWGEREHTLKETGQQLGLTRERVRQIQVETLWRLRHWLDLGD